MHFHLPKPLHGWREFAGEVGIIVIGVLIALGAEQMVESSHWREKVQSAKRSIDFELNQQLDQSDEVVQFGTCAGPFVDALESAIIRHDKTTIKKLHDTRPPFEPRPWRSTAWQSAMSTQVADHIDPDQLSQYAFMFSSFNDMLALQSSIITDFADATTGRLGGPSDPSSTELQLAAAERLRTQLALQDDIARTMIDTAAGRMHQWKPFAREPSPSLHKKIELAGSLCDRTVKSITGSLK